MLLAFYVADTEKKTKIVVGHQNPQNCWKPFPNTYEAKGDQLTIVLTGATRFVPAKDSSR